MIAMNSLSLCIILLLRHVTAADFFLLNQNAMQTGIPCLQTVKYQAQRFEPLCGTFGPSVIYDVPWSLGCSAAMDTFSNNTVDPVALYDTSGVRLRDVRVGANIDLCMCFSLIGRGTSESDLWGDFCFWVSGSGQLKMAASSAFAECGNDGSVLMAYRPNAQKALAKCSGADITALQAS